MLRLGDRDGDADRGSVVMASLIILVMVTLAITVTDRTLSNLGSARLAQDRGATLAAADTALVEAITRIDRGEVAAFSGAGSSGSAIYQYRATPAGSDAWSIRADAQAGRAKRGLQTDLTRVFGSPWVASGWREVPSSNYPSAVRNLSGLVGYWRLNDPAGTVAVDRSDGGHNGTYSASGFVRPVLGPMAGDASGSTRFSGAGGVSLGDNFDMTGTSPYTISFWLKTDPAAADYGRVFDKDRYTPSRDGVVVFTYAAGTKVGCERWSAGVDSVAAAAVPAGAWAHVVCSYDGSSLRAYVNGVLASTTASSGSVSDNALAAQIGRSATSPPVYSSDTIADLAIHSRALSATEVSALATVGVAAPTGSFTATVLATSGLLAHWRLEENGVSNALDSGPLRLNGTWSTGPGGGVPISATGTVGALYGSAGVAARFSGGTRISVPATTSLDLRSTFSVGAWVNLATPTGNNGIVEKTVGSVVNSQWLVFTDSRGLVFRTVAGSTVDLVSSVPLVANTWAYVVATYDGTTMRLYVNGVAAGSKAAAGPLSGGSGEFKIGQLGNVGCVSDPCYSMTGALDEVSVFNRALSSAEVAALYGAGTT